jgi:hypothetical protein
MRYLALAFVVWVSGWEGTRSFAGETDHWSFQLMRRPTIPPVADGAWSRTAIDRFILARLQERGLKPAPEADRRTLIRRLYYDLLGLPPEPVRIREFLSDPRPDAYERLVDELLASPAYGERWARHWLDVVHYGETHGYDKDQPRPNAWPYRDYVIRAFNSDKPYARFVQEQVAGDALFPTTRDGTEALGFLAAGPWDLIGHVEVPETKIDGKIARHLDRDDMVTNALGTFMSLTVQCAACHDHKFDPITQKDYYRLQAVVAALDRTDHAYDPDSQVAQKRRDLQNALAEWKEQLGQVDKQIQSKKTDRADLLGRLLEDVIVRSQHPELFRRRADCERRLAELAKQIEGLPPMQAVYICKIHHGKGAFRGTGPDGGQPRPIHILKRGDVTKPGDPVGPGAIESVSRVMGAMFVFQGGDLARRASLAQWITHPENPLTWRSIVNRVWQYHFGRGLVETANDFGRMGAAPSHPELLDWLALEFRDQGGSLKWLHRLIVTSAVYRQSSAVAPSADDTENIWLSRMNRRKLEAEAIRDAVLAVSGLLDRTMGGPSYRDFVLERPEHSPHYQYHKHDPTDPRSHRRAIYRFIVRSQPEPFLTTLDCADPSLRVDRRNVSLSPVQALALLNNGLILHAAKSWAACLEAATDQRAQQVARAVEAALGRPPSSAELEALCQYSAKHGLANLCRLLFNLNEFVFID